MLHIGKFISHALNAVLLNENELGLRKANRALMARLRYIQVGVRKCNEFN